MPDRAGHFRHRIDVLTRTVTKDAIGAGQETWTTSYRLWARVAHEFRPVDQFARPSAAPVHQDATWFIVRHQGADKVPTETMRLRHEGQIYAIITVRAEQQESTRTIHILGKKVNDAH